MLYIYDYLEKSIKQHLSDVNIHADVFSYIGRAWHENRFIQVIPKGWDRDVHFEYINGHWELHFEAKDDGCVESFRKMLIDKFNVTGEICWHNWNGRQRGLLRYENTVNTDKEFIEYFDVFYNIMSKNFPGNSDDRKNNDATEEYHDPEITIMSINNLPFDKYCIPNYQRPYKWGIKNVNQLIDDILFFKDKSKEYRLGTLVLHKNPFEKSLDIVDGQQRILSLILLLEELSEDKHYKTKLSDLREKINIFATKACFTNGTTKANLQTNLLAIRQRLNDMDEMAVDFLVNNCKFVVVTLYDISEAFQFFDSQNARGKELVPHDLLKAYHLRDIRQMTDSDLDNITQWEECNEVDLAALFLVLFRIKRWVNGKDGLFFTNKDIDIFKGLSPSSNKLPYQKIFLMAECFTKIYNADVSRTIDHNHMDYPHQIDQVVINGRLFFDMISHYMKLEKELYGKIKDTEIVKMLNTYPERNRTGDIYVRELFDAAMLYYYDKFGNNNIDRAEQRIFAWAYSLRLKQSAVKLTSIDNHAKDSVNGFFTFLHQAKMPHELLNWNISVLGTDKIKRNELTSIIDKMKELRYVQ